MLLNSAFSFADFLAYLKTLFAKRTFGLSDFDYPQTVQYFILAALPHSFYNFLLVIAAFLCSLGLFLFVLNEKKEKNSDFSQLSRFLRMNEGKILKQARLAALPKQALLWSFFAPAILVFIFIFEARLGGQGLGSIIKTAFDKADFPLLYGSFVCAFLFILAVNLFFLALRAILK